MLAGLGLLRAVPLWAWALAAAMAWGGWQRLQAQRSSAELGRVADEARAAAVQAAASAVVESERRLAAQQEVVRAQSVRLDRARADAAAAADTARRLRAVLDALAAGRADDPGATPERAPAGPSAPVLADVLGRCTEERRELAQYADAARESGLACQQSYEALRRKP